jgi:cytochrome c-type biogenesis protein CcmH
MEQIEAMADGLRQRLETEPQNAEGWAMLGRSYSVLGRASDAVPAYRKAVELVPDDAGLLADLADSLAVTNNRQIAGEPMTFVQRALKIDPNQPKALSLAGTEAFLRGDFKAAAALWERILASQPADSPMAQQVRESINEARQRGGLPLLVDGEMPKGVTAQAAPQAAPAAQEPATPAQPAAPGKTSVAGTVTLAPALAGKASPEDTVFVFARAAEGPRMPLAIVRKQVKDLPITFTLDDSSAMAPTMKLSNYPQVIVGARISKSGNAMPQPGDLQGLSQPVALGASGLKIVIGEEVGR